MWFRVGQSGCPGNGGVGTINLCTGHQRTPPASDMVFKKLRNVQLRLVRKNITKSECIKRTLRHFGEARRNKSIISESQK